MVRVAGVVRPAAVLDEKGTYEMTEKARATQEGRNKVDDASKKLGPLAKPEVDWLANCGVGIGWFSALNVRQRLAFKKAGRYVLC